MAKAIRPIFLPSDKEDELIVIKNIEFEWFMGMSLSQRKNSMRSLHARAKELGLFPILEISTKSDDVLGNKLSAFNLSLKIDNKTMTVEAAFQGSKIFKNGGPFRDLYHVSGTDIKKDARLKESGELVGFNFNGENWPLEPKTVFYDWLYLTALSQNQDLSSELLKYKGFSDIAFNPKKSFSCQAQSAAIFVSLQNMGYIPSILNDRTLFAAMIGKVARDNSQQKLF